MYVVHGGTNFGLTAGANGLKDKINDYWGAITSYDYEAPINEQGSPTPKYHMLRQMIKKHAEWDVPEVPNSIPMITFADIQVKPQACLFDNISNPLESKQPLLFETSELKMFNQGLALYETELPVVNDYELKIVVHDFGLVYIGDSLVDVLDRTTATQKSVIIQKKLL